MITMWQAFNFAVAIGAGACIGWHGVLGTTALIISFVRLASRLLDWSVVKLVTRLRR